MQEREGRRLLALPRPWGPKEVKAVREWLALFLLGRAALGARVLMVFVTPGSWVEAEPAAQKQLRAQRFFPVSELVPAEAWAQGLWVCVTVTGLVPPEALAEIPRCASELEDAAHRYREAQAAAVAGQAAK